MTAINGLATRTAAYLVTDTAMYEADGLVVGFGAKVHIIGHLKLAIAVTGEFHAMWTISKAMLPFASFDEAIDAIPERMKELWDAGEFEVAGADDEAVDHFRLFVAGWSERSQSGEVYALSSMQEPGLDRFTFLSHSGLSISPSLPLDVWASSGLFAPNGELITRKPADLLGRVIDLQRRTPTPENIYGRSGEVGVIGGHAVLTEISAAGVAQTVIRQWPDRVGEYIDIANLPAAVGSHGSPPIENSGETRQQRRAAQRAENKRLRIV